MKTKLHYLLSGVLLVLLNWQTSVAQNVGISATGVAPAGDAGLDVNFTDKGVLIPRVSLSNTTTYGLTGGGPTTSMLVYNTNGSITGPGAAGEGYYYWSTSAGRWVNLADNLSPGTPWFVGGNTETGAAGTAYAFGHIGNHHIDFYSNNVLRGRISNLGEFFWGTTNTSMPGDLFNVVSNATFPWAINGYSNQNGGGVYGSITGGTTVFGGVQGEYFGTNSQGTGVRGIYGSTTGGTSFGSGLTFPTVASGVSGDATTSGSYKFGIYGSGGTSTRSGGVLGADYGIARGALGYYTSGGVDVAVYGFGNNYLTGVPGGRTKSSENKLTFDNCIGLGIYGGVMGGWIKGLIYGTNLSGERYGLYVHGKTLTNNIIATLHNKTKENNKRIVTYASQSMNNEVSEKGRAQLKNGYANVAFSEEFKALIDEDNITIHITPIGITNGLYIESFNKNGFVVKELNNGNSNVHFFWYATASIKNQDASISEEILDLSFEEKINGPKGVMYNDNNPESPEYSIWWDGQKVRFDMPPSKEELIKKGILERPNVEEFSRFKPKRK